MPTSEMLFSLQMWPMSATTEAQRAIALALDLGCGWEVLRHVLLRDGQKRLLLDYDEGV